MLGAFGPITQGLAISALQNGLSDRFEHVGISRDRLASAAATPLASEQLSSRELGALAYTQGLSGRDTAFLAFGSGRPIQLQPSMDRLARLATAKPAWWSEPSARVGDLGDAGTRRMIGALLGLDLREMHDSDPLPVPADARFAALAKLVLGDHWELQHGIDDKDWIDALNTGHKDIATQFIPFLTKDELVRAEDDQTTFHRVTVPSIPVREAATTFGTGIGMVIAADNKWLQLYVELRDDVLMAKLWHLNDRWLETGRGMRFGLMGLCFEAQSLAEVGSGLIDRVPESRGWNVVSLRFPAKMAAVPVTEERRLA